MDKMTALTIFVAAAEHGSFSRAAEQLGKTPSAITKAVAHRKPSSVCACSSAPPGVWP